MFENGSVLFNHACTAVDVRCVRNDDGSPIVKCVESEPCDSGAIKSCECSGFGDRPNGTQACNEADNCWGPCECTKSVIDTSVDTECYAGDDFYDQADILTVNINLPADDTIDYYPAVIMVFLYLPCTTAAPGEEISAPQTNLAAYDNHGGICASAAAHMMKPAAPRTRHLVTCLLTARASF